MGMADMHGSTTFRLGLDDDFNLEEPQPTPQATVDIATLE